MSSYGGYSTTHSHSGRRRPPMQSVYRPYGGPQNFADSYGVKPGPGAFDEAARIADAMRAQDRYNWAREQEMEMERARGGRTPTMGYEPRTPMSSRSHSGSAVGRRDIDAPGYFDGPQGGYPPPVPMDYRESTMLPERGYQRQYSGSAVGHGRRDLDRMPRIGPPPPGYDRDARGMGMPYEPQPHRYLDGRADAYPTPQPYPNGAYPDGGYPEEYYPPAPAPVYPTRSRSGRMQPYEYEYDRPVDVDSRALVYPAGAPAPAPYGPPYYVPTPGMPMPMPMHGEYTSGDEDDVDDAASFSTASERNGHRGRSGSWEDLSRSESGSDYDDGDGYESASFGSEGYDSGDYEDPYD